MRNKRINKLAAIFIAVLAASVVSGCNSFENPNATDDTVDAQDGDGADTSTDTQADNGQGTDATVDAGTDASSQDLGNQDTAQPAPDAQEVQQEVTATDTGPKPECDKAADCDDKNVCTTDFCDANKCQHSAAAGNCDDGNACTDSDACKDGACKGTAKVCEDNNPCTDDFCINGGVCVHGINAVPCDDGNACTVGDKCQSGLCQGGAAKDCNDNNPCTTDSCDSNKGCISIPVTCEDNNPCTTDSCETATGNCQFSQKVCDDGQDYTDDWCDSYGWYGDAGQCVFEKKWGACKDNGGCADGNACTEDVCDFGQCKWVSKNCNDNDPCTIDECVPAKGCVNKVVNCNDNDANTTDSCDSKTGACLHTPISVPPTNPPPSGSGTVNVSVSCGSVACEVHPFFGLAADGKSFDNFGPAQANSWYTSDLPKSQLCSWGMEVAARLNTATWPWFGCDAGAPSLTTVTVKVNGVVVTGVLTKHPWTCGGGGEGNLLFTKAQLGCP